MIARWGLRNPPRFIPQGDDDTVKPGNGVPRTATWAEGARPWRRPSEDWDNVDWGFAEACAHSKQDEDVEIGRAHV